MDDTIGSDGGTPSLAPTVTSILGLKDDLRLRLHGSTQKPHVVLRQVEITEEVDKDGQPRKTVWYSLFAAKRIEVKPGKEILLAFPDGIFGDQPIVFEGDLPEPEKRTDAEGVPGAGEEDEFLGAEEPMEQAVPPKMRKAWRTRPVGGTGTALASAANPDPIAAKTFASLGIQVQAEHADIATQTQPLCYSQSIQASVSTQTVSCQVSPSYASTPVQVEQPVPPLSVSRTAQASGHESTMPMKDLKDLPVEDAEPSISANQPDATPGSPHGSESTDRQRSLSPMELDSPSSTPPQSPTVHASGRASYDSLASSRAGSVPKQLTTNSTHIMHDTDLSSLAQPSLPSISTSPSTLPKKLLEPSVQSPSFVRGIAGLPPKPTQSTQVTDSPHTTQRLGKRGRSPPTGPRSLMSQGAGLRPDGPQDPPPPLGSTGRGVPASPMNVPHVPSRVPPPVPDVSIQWQTPPPGYKRVGSVTADQKAAVPSSSEWKPTSVAPLPPVAGPLGNPLGIRPSVCPTVWNGVTPKKSVPPKGPAAFSTNKKPVVVGAGWPFTRHHSSGSVTQANSPTPSPSTTTTSATSYKQGTPPDNVPLPLPTPGSSPRHPLPEAVVSSTSTTLQLPGIVSYRSPSPDGSTRPVATPRPSQARRISSTPVKFVSNGLQSSAAPSSQSSPSPSAVKVGLPESTRTALPVQVKLEEQPLGPPPGMRPEENALTGLTSAGPSNAEFDHPPGLGSPTKPTLVASAGHKAPPQSQTAAVKHPLPPKPVAPGGPAPHKYEPNRPVIGVKRSASIATHEQPQSHPARRRSFKWPVLECIHSVRVKGDENVGIRGITFNSNGSHFAVNCQDSTVRIWNNHSHTELASLKHNAPVVSVAWMDDDAGVVSLGDNGTVSKWTRLGQNKWHWAKILDAGRPDEDPACLAYMKDRIAVAFPRTGVKVWLWIKGTWQPQRSILRQNVTAIRFVEDGDALIGGTTDGVLWYCQVPNGTLRAYSFFKSKVYHLDVDSQGTSALVAQHGGRCHLVGIEDGRKGTIERAYVLKDTEIQNATLYDFGAIFANGDQSVLFGDLHGCVLVWDKMGAEVSYGLDHGDETVQAVASFGSRVVSSEHYLVTGTKQGQLTWWPHSLSDSDPRKRVKSDLD